MASGSRRAVGMASPDRFPSDIWDSRYTEIYLYQMFFFLKSPLQMANRRRRSMGFPFPIPMARSGRLRIGIRIRVDWKQAAHTLFHIIRHIHVAAESRRIHKPADAATARGVPTSFNSCAVPRLNPWELYRPASVTCNLSSTARRILLKLRRLTDENSRVPGATRARMAGHSV